MRILIVVLLATLTVYGQKSMDNTFITWDDFTNNFGKEMTVAEDVYDNMAKSGLKDNCLTKMDFTFISDKKENLIRLRDFIKIHYPYTVKEVQKYQNIWEINGETNDIPITSDNLLFWALDMYKRGYEFDAKLDAYGGPFDPVKQEYPDFGKMNEDTYFDKGVESYEKGDLSGAIINWSLTLVINSKNPDAYYSRAIAKNELYTWKAALTDYNKALEIAPDFIDALVNRGSLKDENGDFDGAIADYNTALTIKTIDAENKKMAYFNRGNSKYNLNDKNGACKDWNTAYKLGAEYALEKIKVKCE